MVYVALLRGINVGGKNKIHMKILKETFEQVGMSNVSTYINSGNIVFSDSTRTRGEIEKTLEQAILEDFNLQIRILVCSIKDFDVVMRAIPESYTNDQNMKSDVLFLWDEIDDASILTQLTINAVDTVEYVARAVLWSVAREDAVKSGMVKLASARLYKQMTIRNVNTTRKIYELMQGIKE